MKKFVFLFTLGLFTIHSCSLTKVSREAKRTINGSWELSTIDYKNNSGFFKSILFEDVEAFCFEGSQWTFISNNSTGSYTIDKPGDCMKGTRYMRWVVIENDSEPHTFQFKYLDENKKDISGGYGHRLNIDFLDDSKMTLSSDVKVKSETVTVVYNFNKKN